MAVGVEFAGDVQISGTQRRVQRAAEPGGEDGRGPLGGGLRHAGCYPFPSDAGNAHAGAGIGEPAQGPLDAGRFNGHWRQYE